jgi:hypothetical protein
MTELVSIAGLDKAKVLKALHDGSKAQGVSFMHLRELSLEDCEGIISQEAGEGNDDLYFDYLAGKVMKVAIGGDEFNPCGYDRDNGPGAAQKVIDLLRQGLEDQIESSEPGQVAPQTVEEVRELFARNPLKMTLLSRPEDLKPRLEGPDA